jgi:hypothetical protein
MFALMSKLQVWRILFARGCKKICVVLALPKLHDGWHPAFLRIPRFDLYFPVRLVSELMNENQSSKRGPEHRQNASLRRTEGTGTFRRGRDVDTPTAAEAL